MNSSTLANELINIFGNASTGTAVILSVLLSLSHFFHSHHGFPKNILVGNLCR